jgi:hypothetical protein
MGPGLRAALKIKKMAPIVLMGANLFLHELVMLILALLVLL